MFKISDYQGLRYLRNSFFFYGTALIIRFIIGTENYPFMNFFYEFFLVVASFSLFYSLVWKFLGPIKNYHSLFNLRMSLFYLVSFFISSVDFFLKTSVLLYSSQIIIFFLMGCISYKNYLKDKNQNLFLLFYFIAMCLGFFIGAFNLYFSYWANITSEFIVLIYCMNFFFFLIFLYGLMRTNKNG
jgi:hypothetical protein